MHVSQAVFEFLKFGVGKTDELPKLEGTLRKMYAELQKTHKPKRKPRARTKRRR